MPCGGSSDHIDAALTGIGLMQVAGGSAGGKLLRSWRWGSMRVAQRAWLVACVNNTCSDMVHRGPDFVLVLIVVAVNEVTNGCQG